jgi:L-aspartate oxidase
MKRSDFLVIGSGAAGLSVALSLAEHGTVTVVTKKNSAESNTNYAQGGIAVAIHDADSIESHVSDTLIAGAGLCDEAAVRSIVSEGPKRLSELQSRGASFTKQGDGNLDLGREGGHSHNRIVHSLDATGREVERTLLDAARSAPNIVLLEHHFAVDLLTDHQAGAGSHARNHGAISPGQCYGAYVLDDRSNVVDVYQAKVTILATGGTGQVYQHTTNPEVATGDGLAMAYRAGARLRHLEFMQFHPTTLFHEKANSFLITEAVRGEGAVLRNMQGNPFMTQYDKRADLAPRDIVARAIDDQMKSTGDAHVWLDATVLGRTNLESRFPTIYERCLGFGIDMATDYIPIVPAAHYMCGGVATDLSAQTSIRNLLACGEVAATGLHGANRLASNSLLEALVMSHRASHTAIQLAPETSFRTDIPAWDISGTVDPQEWILVSHNRDELRRTMTNYVGIVRSVSRLERARRRTHLLYEETETFYRASVLSVSLCELRNLIAVGHMIIQSAMARKESKGLHFMADFTAETFE